MSTDPTGQVVIRSKGETRETDLVKPTGPKPRAKAAKAQYEADMQAYKDATDPLDVVTRYNLYYEDRTLILCTDAGWKLAVSSLKDESIDLLAPESTSDTFIELYINNALVVKQECGYDMKLAPYIDLFRATLT